LLMSLTEHATGKGKWNRGRKTGWPFCIY